MLRNLVMCGRRLLATAGLVALAGCASAPDVRVGFDRSADFSSYRTFAFADPLGTDRGGYQSIVSKHLKEATQRELEARGLRLDPGTPQLLVNFNATVTDKVDVSTVPTAVIGIGIGRGGYYRYRGSLYGTWPLYVDQTVATPYKEGTINIDVADVARKQLVWEGVVTGVVTQKALDELPQSLDAAVRAAFEQFPSPK